MPDPRITIILLCAFRRYAEKLEEKDLAVTGDWADQDQEEPDETGPGRSERKRAASPADVTAEPDSQDQLPVEEEEEYVIEDFDD